MSMTLSAKSELAKTIRSLHKQLIPILYQTTISIYEREDKEAISDEDTRKKLQFEKWITAQIHAKKIPIVHAQKHNFLLHHALPRLLYTHINRHIYLRLLEGFRLLPLIKERPKSRAQLMHDLAIELPGMFGKDKIEDLIPFPSTAQKKIIEEFKKPQLNSCWRDDMTLGWVYQFWNDAQKENKPPKSKVENHEISSQTQLFTERYIVEWLLQNSLGAKWFAICAKKGWVPKVQSSGTLHTLESRRAQWRAKREAKEVGLDELMPLHNEIEKQW